MQLLQIDCRLPFAGGLTPTCGTGYNIATDTASVDLCIILQEGEKVRKGVLKATLLLELPNLGLSD